MQSTIVSIEKYVLEIGSIFKKGDCLYIVTEIEDDSYLITEFVKKSDVYMYLDCDESVKQTDKDFFEDVVYICNIFEFDV